MALPIEKLCFLLYFCSCPVWGFSMLSKSSCLRYTWDCTRISFIKDLYSDSTFRLLFHLSVFFRAMQSMHPFDRSVLCFMPDEQGRSWGTSKIKTAIFRLSDYNVKSFYIILYISYQMYKLVTCLIHTTSRW